MSFGIFPSFYEDELAYSLVARYHIKSGNIRYKDTFIELFGEVPANTETEFFNPLTESAEAMFTKESSLENVIFQHTMFPQSVRFLDVSYMKEAYDSILAMRGGNGGLSVLNKKASEEQYFRYCPLCVQTDRKKYGETYWHRKHQLKRLNICPVHHCKLHSSSVPVRKGSSFKVCAAEHEAVEEKVEYSENQREIQLAEYMTELFELPINFNNTVSLQSFLQSKLEYTKYMSNTGKNRKLSILTEDFMNFYKDLPEGSQSIFSESQLLDIFLEDRRDYYTIAQLGLFLNIMPSGFNCMELPEKSQYQLFEENVRELHNKGYGYNRIAATLNVEITNVRSILSPRKSQNNSNRRKSEQHSQDWNEFDKGLLPTVEELVTELYGTNGERPRRVRPATVQRKLNLPENIFNRLPRCKSVIMSKAETQEQYYARQISWAVEQIDMSGVPFHWRKIQLLTNMRKKDLISCLPYIADDEVRARLELWV